MPSLRLRKRINGLNSANGHLVRFPAGLLSRFLDKHRDIWEKDYLWVKLDHRWTGALEMVKRMRGNDEGTIPWVAILNVSGKVVITSTDKDGTKVGDPSSDNEPISRFPAMLPALTLTSNGSGNNSLGRRT